MAVGEARKQVSRGGNQISQVSWTDGTALDVYYGLDHSFQYSRNINTDDELHGIKLSTKAYKVNYYSKCQLTSVGDNGVVALNVSGLAKPIWFDQYDFFSGGTEDSDDPAPQTNQKVCPGVVFQDYFWFSVTNNNRTALCARRVNRNGSAYIVTPDDHNESTDEDIETPNPTPPGQMKGNVTAILNYNNTRLVVATSGADPAVWVYYPELDQTSPVTHPTPGAGTAGQTGWKKVLSYEAGVTIVGLTCSFEYLKVWAVDEGWNTKVYYYQGNNNLRNTFVYNLVDLTGVRVTRVYNINGIDYYVSSLDGTDGFVNLYKLVGTTPVQLFKQRAGLDSLDVNYKAPYFVGPTSIGAAYAMGKFYIADAYGLFQFTYNANSYDTGYMKRGLYDNKQVYGVCENQGYLYVSVSDGCYIMRLWDTGKPVPESKNQETGVVTYKTEGYQTDGVLISREYEGKEGGTVTKMLDEIRMNFELNPNTTGNGTIDVYVSPNNLWKNTHTFTEANNWYHAMHITQDSAGTRAEKSNLFNDLGGTTGNKQSSFKFDWQTITYAIVITRGTEPKATPIVRQIDIKYHCKDKINNVYDIN